MPLQVAGVQGPNALKRVSSFINEPQNSQKTRFSLTPQLYNLLLKNYEGNGQIIDHWEPKVRVKELRNP